MNMIRSCGLDDISTAYVDRKRKESVIVRRHNDIVGDIILAPDLSIFQDVLYNERIFNSDVPVVEKNVIS